MANRKKTNAHELESFAKLLQETLSANELSALTEYVLYVLMEEIKDEV
jgi:hypothetical protein